MVWCPHGQRGASAAARSGAATEVTGAARSPGSRSGARGWSAGPSRPAGCPSRWIPRTCRCFLAALGRTGTGRSCWRCCWAVCGPVRSAACCSPMSTGTPRLRVVGKGGRERVVPVDRRVLRRAAAYLAWERPPGWRRRSASWCCVGPTCRAGELTESGLRSVFRHHRRRSGAVRVRPHRLRHTYGTELAAAGIDLLALRH